jgi:hypothetical protein
VKSAFEFAVQGNKEGEGGEINLGVAHVRCGKFKFK